MLAGFHDEIVLAIVMNIYTYNFKILTSLCWVTLAVKIIKKLWRWLKDPLRNAVRLSHDRWLAGLAVKSMDMI